MRTGNKSVIAFENLYFSFPPPALALCLLTELIRYCSLVKARCENT